MAFVEVHSQGLVRCPDEQMSNLHIPHRMAQHKVRQDNNSLYAVQKVHEPQAGVGQERGVMDSGQDLIIAMSQTRKQLNECLIFYKNNGRQLADAEMKYKIAYRKEVFRLHVEDSVAWTACSDLAKGSEEVAKLRMERDIRKSDYESCYEKILALKMELHIIENEINSERRGM